MCGIAGRVGPHAGKSDSLRRMTDSLEHRGPDDEGFFIDNGIELGARRLSIVDVVGGHQPISTFDQEVTVAFNGEIYNYLLLRKELLERGCPLKTHGDTEVLAYLYLLDGKDFVHKLRGMFAISIWDARSRTLLLFRDRTGEKPLLYSEKNGKGLDFASEAKALLSVGSEKSVDLVAIDFVLNFGYAPPPMTGFSCIQALPPGHLLVWHDGRYAIEKYWNFNSADKENFNYQDAQKAVHGVLEESVKMQLVAERPLGIFLSGGVDSTLVTALAAKNSMRKLKTFSIGFKDERFDESKYARIVAEHIGTEHHELIFDPKPETMLSILTNKLDRPFADSSVIPTFLLSEFARTEVVVALGGDGGDEALGGYSRYLALERRHALNFPIKAISPMASLVGRLAANSNPRILPLLEGATRNYENKGDRYRGLVSMVHDDERSSLWSREAKEKVDLLKSKEWFNSIWIGARAQGAKDRALAVDIATYLPEDLNFKTDFSSMAHGLELRSPYQDFKFLELCGRIDGNIKFHGGITKSILKQIAKEYVPESVNDRKKMGFGFPRASWLRNELRSTVSDVLLSTEAKSRGWFNQEEIQKLITMHSQGVDRDRILWPLLVIELWAQKWLD